MRPRLRIEKRKSSEEHGDEVRFMLPRGDAYADLRIGTPQQVVAYVRSVFGDGVSYIDEDIEAARHAAPIAYLEWIWVPDRSRGRGVGERLLALVLGWLDTEGAAATYAISAPGEEEDPDRLLQWYLRHGFDVLANDTLGDAIEIVRRRA